MSRNVYAHTAPGASYPEYISVNETDDPNLFTIVVRSPAKPDGSCGDAAQITLTMAQTEELAGAIIRANTGSSV